MLSCPVTWVNLASDWPKAGHRPFRKAIKGASPRRLRTFQLTRVRWVECEICRILEWDTLTHARHVWGLATCPVTLWGHKELKANCGLPPVLTSRIQTLLFSGVGNIISREQFKIKLSLTWTCSWSSPTHVKTCSSALIVGLYLPPTRPLGRSLESFLEMFWSSARLPGPSLFMHESPGDWTLSPDYNDCGMYTDLLHGMNK